jgi:hypothetical protein
VTSTECSPERALLAVSIKHRVAIVILVDRPMRPATSPVDPPVGAVKPWESVLKQCHFYLAFSRVGLKRDVE